LIGLTPKAARQLDALRRHYLERERLEALRNLAAAVADAIALIEHNPGAGVAAPRPYPALAKAGRGWVKSGRYWAMYSTMRPPVITGIFHDTSDIANRL